MNLNDIWRVIVCSGVRVVVCDVFDGGNKGRGLCAESLKVLADFAETMRVCALGKNSRIRGEAQ